MRLIDADALADTLYERYCEDCDKRKGMKNGKMRTIYAVGDAPCRACGIDDMIGELEDAPTAQPEPQWIPCSERLPEDDTLMLVNYIENRPEAMDIWIGWHEMENVWYIDGEEYSKEYGNEVIAWMPLPTPYQENADV